MDLTAAERAAWDAARLRDAALSPGERRRAGVVHTAPELARFAARAVDDVLRGELGCARGLSDPQVALIDPACGPGAFFAAALAVAQESSSAPRALLGLDRDPAAIAAARAALAPSLARAQWPCTLETRDTLEHARPEAIAKLAPVAVVLGNPPWVASAQARPAPWLDALLEDFRRDADSVPLGERKIGVLADAYVRFMRWACAVACSAQRGAVLAFVTNASYLDGPVHRGMRAALRRFFDELHVLDLGGSALLARGLLRGVRDDNVFGVRPAAAVLIGVRRPDAAPQRLAAVRYMRLLGTLAHKLEQLAELRLADPQFAPLSLDPAQTRFVPTAAPHADYARWPSLAEAMPFHQEGVQTNRDAVVVDCDRARLLERLRAFAAGGVGEELAPALVRRSHYDPEAARRALQGALEADPTGASALRELAYRPLDTRWFVPIAPLCHRPRPRLLAAMQRSGFALISVRKDRGGACWAHFGAARHAIDNCWLSTRSSCRARAFPTRDPEGRDNLAPQLAAELSERAGRAVSAEDFACYALAVLASPGYRSRHQAALYVDYPRIPLPADAARFEALRGAGAELVELLCAPLPLGAALRGAAPALSVAQGLLLRGEESVCELDPALLGFTLGHQRVLHELLRSPFAAHAGAGVLRAACARVAAIARCIAALDRI